METMSKQKIEIIEKYLDEQQPGFFARTLARKIVAENPGIFDQTDKEIDNVRRNIRYRTGAGGDYHRKLAASSGKLRAEFVRDEMKPSEYMANFLQRGETTSKPDWHLPKHHRKVLVLSDIHIPYHSLEALENGY